MLDNQVIIVTGGAGLLGRSFCTSIAQMHAQVIVADINMDCAQEVAQYVKSTGGKAEAAYLDITDTESVDSLITTVHNHYGHIDAIVNNAYPRNKNWGQNLENITYADFCENINLHLGGYFLTTQKFALYFRKQGGGNIVNMASIYGGIMPRFEIYENTMMTMPVEYTVIKSSIIQLSRYFAKYFKSDGVRCNTLSPGGIYNQQPKSFVERYNDYCGKKGMLDGQDVIGSLIFLLSDASCCVTGQNIIVDDGFCL